MAEMGCPTVNFAGIDLGDREIESWRDARNLGSSPGSGKTSFGCSSCCFGQGRGKEAISMNEFMTSLGQGLTGTNLLTLKEAENSIYRSLQTLAGPSP